MAKCERKGCGGLIKRINLGRGEGGLSFDICCKCKNRTRVAIEKGPKLSPPELPPDQMWKSRVFKKLTAEAPVEPTTESDPDYGF